MRFSESAWEQYVDEVRKAAPNLPIVHPITICSEYAAEVLHPTTEGVINDFLVATWQELHEKIKDCLALVNIDQHSQLNFAFINAFEAEFPSNIPVESTVGQMHEHIASWHPESKAPAMYATIRSSLRYNMQQLPKPPFTMQVDYLRELLNDEIDKLFIIDSELV